MPTYEYQCDKCGHRFERFQSIKADPIRKCPQCGKNAVHRLISGGAGLIFKGSGFYITDYRDSSYKDKAKADSGDSKPAETTASGNDSKPAETKPADAKNSGASDAKARGETKAKSEPKPAKSEGKTPPAAKK